MANLLVRLNRIKDEKKEKYIVKFKSKEPSGTKTVLIKRVNHDWYFENELDKNFRYKYGNDFRLDNHGMFYDVEKLDKRFPGITKAEVISKEFDGYYNVLTLDYTTENFFKTRQKVGIIEAYDEMKKRKGKEVINTTKTLIKTLKQKGIVFDERNIIETINYYCVDEYETKALQQCLYILQNDIRATKGRYCYGVRKIWENLGFKVIKLYGVKGIKRNGEWCNDANYVFLTERSKMR